MISPTKIQIDSGLIKLDQDDINFIQKNSKLNAADKFEDINLPLGPIEQIMEGERFQLYKNKNQLTIQTFTKEEVDFFRIQESERYKVP